MTQTVCRLYMYVAARWIWNPHGSTFRARDIPRAERLDSTLRRYSRSIPASATTPQTSSNGSSGGISSRTSTKGESSDRLALRCPEGGKISSDQPSASCVLLWAKVRQKLGLTPSGGLRYNSASLVNLGSRCKPGTAHATVSAESRSKVSHWSRNSGKAALD